MAQQVHSEFTFKILRIGMLVAVLLGARRADAGTGRQTTTFLVEADEQAVSRWIERNSSSLDESTGAEVLAVRGRQSTLRKHTKEGTMTFVVEHDPVQHGQFTTNLLKSDNLNLVAQKTEIQVEREGPGARVTITVVVTVNDHSAMAISLGIRPSLRGMRKLLEGRFGSPNER
jgi:hypothetical protein